jgi:hypothetical protein
MVRQKFPLHFQFRIRLHQGFSEYFCWAGKAAVESYVASQAACKLPNKICIDRGCTRGTCAVARHEEGIVIQVSNKLY